jgi:hypothetical protein
VRYRSLPLGEQVTMVLLGATIVVAGIIMLAMSL